MFPVASIIQKIQKFDFHLISNPIITCCCSKLHLMTHRECHVPLGVQRTWPQVCRWSRVIVSCQRETTPQLLHDRCQLQRGLISGIFGGEADTSGSQIFLPFVWQSDESRWQLELYVLKSLQENKLLFSYRRVSSQHCTLILSGCLTAFWKWKTMNALYEMSFLGQWALWALERDEDKLLMTVPNSQDLE